jgi:UDP-N-acetylglucosamine 3-dehydrogenase
VTVAIGILSVAHGHANSYARAVQGIEGAELVGVADGDAERGRSFAERHEIEYADAATVLDRSDGAIVCAANADHLTWVERAAAAGVDALCEKPLATSAEAAQAAVDACEAAGVALGVAMPVRFSEPIRRAKAAVDAGEVGDVQAYVGTNLLQASGVAGWFVDPERSGGGAIMDHSVHVVDLVRWISGREVAEVYAESGTAFRERPVEDIDVLSMSLEDGTPFTHDGSWRQPDEWDTWGDVTLRIVGTDGVIEVDCFDQTLRHTRDTGDDPGIDSVFWGSDTDEELIADFVATVREDRQPAIPGWEGAHAVRVVEAAYASVERGAPIVIDY